MTCSLIDELFTYKKRAPQDSSSNVTLDENISYDLSEALPMWHSVLLFINSVRTNPAVTEHLRHSSKSRDERASPDVATATTNKSDMALLGKGHAKGKRKNKPNKEKATTLLSNTILSNASHVVGSHAHSATCVAPDEYLGDLIRRFRLIMSPSSNSPQNAFLFTPTNKQEDAMEFLTFLLDVLHEEALLHVTSELGTETIRDLDRKEKEIVDENAAEDSEEGWTEVRKCGTGSSAKVSGIKVVIDEATRLSTTREVASSLVGQLFHGILRSEVVYSRKHMSSVTFQKFHCLTLNVDRISIPHSDDQKKLTKRPVTPHYLQYTNSSRPNGVGYNQPCKLEDAFLNYFKEEKVS